MFDEAITDDVLQLSRPDTQWLSTGWNGGTSRCDVAYNMTVPHGWDRTDVHSYIGERRQDAGFSTEGPTLLTGVGMQHLRGARLGPVVGYATVGLSNPAALPMDPPEGDVEPGVHDGAFDQADREIVDDDDSATRPRNGTVNIIVGTTRSLTDAAEANLLTVVAEAKAATLLAAVGIPGTTSDAVVVASDPAGESTTFTGSSTAVGAAARACVRDAIRASFQSRYAEESAPDSVETAKHGVTTRRRAEVFSP
ncbi:MAG: hypothetical protein J07HR59_01021 [Halorubrum sp. J07HR59]|nr:MAG: hypothetical protein J07HR59_01021 [Halorubrum sp. J07HR59]